MCVGFLFCFFLSFRFFRGDGGLYEKNCKIKMKCFVEVDVRGGGGG